MMCEKTEKQGLFIAALLMTVIYWKLLKCPSTGDSEVNYGTYIGTP